MTAPTSTLSSDKDLAEFLTDHILDESLDPTLTAILLSQAKNRIETLERPEILIDEDSTQTRSSGDTFETMKPLPDNFRSAIELRVENVLFQPVPFAKRRAYRFSGQRYYINHKDRQYAICGSGGAGTINLTYLIKTDDFTASSVENENAATCVWPKEHWNLIAWEAAEIVSTGTDVGVDDISYRMGAAHLEQKERALQAFRAWDHQIKLDSMGGRRGYADDEGTDFENDVLPYMG